MKRIGIVLEFVKIKIAFAITFTTVTGFLLFSRSISPDLVFSVIGVLLMSAGAMGLNQFQEKHFDSRMHRTMARPLPRKELNENTALLIAVLLILAGGFILQFFLNSSCMILGFFNVFWYNIVYTYLKRVTVFAVVPGALVGVVPAFIGWCAAGGGFFDFRIFCLGLFLFIWQIPHFWLILYHHNSDYVRAGFPSIGRSFSMDRVLGIVFVWLIASCFATLLFPVFGIVSNGILLFLLILVNFSVIVIFYFQLLRTKGTPNLKLSLSGINIYMLAVLFLVVISAFV